MLLVGATTYPLKLECTYHPLRNSVSNCMLALLNLL